MAADKKYFRLFDANLNRSREGLRVLEDTARFVLRKPALYQQLRAVRHGADVSTRAIYTQLLEMRNSVQDSGRTMKESSTRAGLGAVVAANCRRVEESLRVLEEYSKIVHPKAAGSFKALRYTMYTLEKKLVRHV